MVVSSDRSPVFTWLSIILSLLGKPSLAPEGGLSNRKKAGEMGPPAAAGGLNRGAAAAGLHRRDRRALDWPLHAVRNEGLKPQERDARHEEIPPEVLAPLLIFRGDDRRVRG